LEHVTPKRSRALQWEMAINANRLYARGLAVAQIARNLKCKPDTAHALLDWYAKIHRHFIRRHKWQHVQLQKHEEVIRSGWEEFQKTMDVRARAAFLGRINSAIESQNRILGLDRSGQEVHEHMTLIVNSNVPRDPGTFVQRNRMEDLMREAGLGKAGNGEGTGNPKG